MSFPFRAHLLHRLIMKIKLPLLCLTLLCVAPFARAYDPLYKITLQSTPAFEIVGHPDLAFYPFSEGMGSMIRRSKVRRILAADATSVTLRSGRPEQVLSQVLQQISEQTGLKLSSTHNSATPPTEPVFFRQGFSDTAVITLLLVPAENGLYQLTCHYIIDERPPGSNDGTPEGIADLKKLKAEMQRVMTADSIASTLPARIANADLKSTDYFRPLQGPFTLPDGSGVSLTVLMTKRQDHYTAGFYSEIDDTLVRIGDPADFAGTRPPYVTNLPASPGKPGQPTPTCLRADKLDGHGGYYVSLEDGKVIKRKF